MFLSFTTVFGNYLVTDGTKEQIYYGKLDVSVRGRPGGSI